MAFPLPQNVVFLAIDTSAASGITNPDPQLFGYFLPFDQSGNALGTAKNFCNSKNYPLGTTAYVIDLSATQLTILEFKLGANWMQQ